jgi:hypothetical protein
VEECTFFWGVKSSWGINMAENKDLLIKKIIKLHNQQRLRPKHQMHTKTKHAPLFSFLILLPTTSIAFKIWELDE